MAENQTIISLRGAERIWAISAIHGEAERLAALHDRMAEEIGSRDRIVYLGNYFGHGPDGREVLDELIRFRRWFLSYPPYMDGQDIVFLRGAQEEMWTKLVQLQFATDAVAVLDFMAARGMGEALAAFGGDLSAARRAAREGTVPLTYWCNRLRDRQRAILGHDDFMRGLVHAAALLPDEDKADEGDTGTLFLHTGLDPEKTLDAQSDAFWWASKSFERIDAPFQNFTRIVRGYDPEGAGVIDTAHTLSIDAGAGRGGPLTAVRLSPAGALEKRYTV
jgi:serine/threonine protein phosphatase 1